MNQRPPTGYDQLNPALAERVDAVCDRLEKAWRSGQRPLLEEYVAEVPEAAVLVLLRELILVDILYRQREGVAAQPADYQARFPALDSTWLTAALSESGGVVSGGVVSGKDIEPGSLGTSHHSPLTTHQHDAACQTPSIPGFTVLDELGRGGMGVVYKAQDNRLGRLVALKVPRADALADPALRVRFQNEARAAAGLDHTNLVPVYEAGEAGGVFYIASAYCPGVTLAAWLQQHPEPVPARAAAGLVATLADAVHHAHARGILHRDLKPANVLLQIADSRLQIEGKENPSTNQSAISNLQSAIPKIADFGLAKHLPGLPGGRAGARQTLAGQILGTPSYMAPEQAGGKADIGPPTDVYALGAILYELLTGRPPFEGESILEILEQVRSAEPVSPGRLRLRVPRDLETITLKCLDKEPRRRYGSALALAEDLRRFLDGLPIRARPAGVLERALKWAQRRPAVAALGAGVCVTFAVGFAGVTWQWREAEGSRREAEARLYFNRIALAQQAWRDYQVGQADRLLDEYLDPGRNDPRSWEWHYLKRLCHSDLFTLEGHTHAVGGVAFSRDGRLLASCSGEWRGEQPGEVRVWDAATGDPLHTFRGHQRAVYNVAISPDGRLVASASYDHTVRLWDLTRPQNEEVILPNEAVVMNVAFSPDGGLLVAPCADGVVRIWDVRMRTLLRTYQGHPHNGNVFAVAFHPTERYIATGGRLGQAVRLWDPATGQDLRTLPWAASVRSLAFSADGKLLAAASYEGVVKVWDATPGGAELSTHHLYAGAVLSLAFSPDGSKLVWCTSTGRVQIIEPRTGAEVRTLRGHDGAVLGVAFSPDGRRLATAGGDRRVRVWDADAPQEVRSFGKEGGWNYGCAFSPDAHYVALAGGISQSNKGAGHRSVRLWDLEGRRLVKEFAAPDYLTSVAYGPGGDQLAAGSEDGTALLWDVATAAVRHELKGHSGVVTGIAYSPDGRDLATAGADGTVRLWDTATGKEARRFLEDGDPVTGVAYSPDGRLVAASISDGTVRLWNAATEREVHTLRGHDKAVTCVVFSPDSKWLASTGLDLTVRLWDVHTGKETRPRNEPLRLGGPAPEEKRKPWDRTRPLVPHLAFSADGRRLASINGIQPVQLWDVATGLEVLTLPVQESGFLCLAFGPDGRRLVAAAGGWVHVWDADTARLLTR